MLLIVVTEGQNNTWKCSTLGFSMSEHLFLFFKGYEEVLPAELIIYLFI